MAQFYTCIDGEMLDEICESYYGKTRGFVEQVMAHDNNRELAKKLPVLEAGDQVYLPDLSTSTTSTTSTSRLWS